MKQIRYTIYGSLAIVMIIALCVLSVSCGGKNNDDDSAEDLKMSVTGRLKACSELVTTRIQLRSIQRIYIDNGNISLNPKTWHLDRMKNILVVLPLDVTVNYGYDLKDLQVDIVKVDDDKSEVWVYLPDPHIISSTYDPRVPMDIEVIPSDANPSQGQISRGMQIAYRHVIGNFEATNYRAEAENNARAVFEDILKNINYKFSEVHIANIKDRH